MDRMTDHAAVERKPGNSLASWPTILYCTERMCIVRDWPPYRPSARLARRSRFKIDPLVNPEE